MDATPLTSTPARTPERRVLGALTIAAAAVLALSACGGAVSEALGRGPEPRASAYPSGADAKSAQALPAWAPDAATDVRVKQRPGGAERIVTMRAGLADLPDDCVPVSADRPLAPAPAEGDPTDFRTVSTLAADWWPAEAEQDATVMCGAWWVGERDGVLYAFTPERRTVAVG
ncbi:hypothetical protein [Cellulomonas pakistanensis]|uniref:Lipoprotein n=1 Tax=Cellulomonas pakistanensis TaxID=992287 RepID=A0A919P8Y2_9CELL|nr:hypothetical protein [Cellulomonas pakistanensis]GIG36540.1 hypothetical protein Cpa01nite_19210 [Cellulomonas pakistanensis]